MRKPNLPQLATYRVSLFILLYLHTAAIYKASLLQRYKQTVDCFRLVFVRDHLTHRIVVVPSRNCKAEFLSFENAAAFRIWDHSYAVLASRIFGGLVLLQRVEMGRDRERIVNKRMAMVVEAGDGQNEPLSKKRERPIRRQSG